MNEDEKFRLEVVYDDENGNPIHEVIDPDDTKRLIELVEMKAKEKVQTKRVPYDTKLGIIGKTKRIKFKRRNTVYANVDINYLIEDGKVKFRNFEQFTALGFLIQKVTTEDGDLLQVDLGKQVFAVTDKREVKKIRYVLNLIQRYNNEFLQETDVDDLEDSDFEENDTSLPKDNEEENTDFNEENKEDNEFSTSTENYPTHNFTENNN